MKKFASYLIARPTRLPEEFGGFLCPNGLMARTLGTLLSVGANVGWQDIIVDPSIYGVEADPFPCAISLHIEDERNDEVQLVWTASTPDEFEKAEILKKAIDADGPVRSVAIVTGAHKGGGITLYDAEGEHGGASVYRCPFCSTAYIAPAGAVECPVCHNELELVTDAPNAYWHDVASDKGVSPFEAHTNKGTLTQTTIEY